MTMQTTGTFQASNPDWNAYRIILGRPAYFQENYAAKRTADLDKLVADANQATDETPMRDLHYMMADILGFLGSYYEDYEREEFETLTGEDRQKWYEGLIGRITGETLNTVKSETWLSRYGDTVEAKLVGAAESLVFLKKSNRPDTDALKTLLAEVADAADTGKLSATEITDLEATLKQYLQ